MPLPHMSMVQGEENVQFLKKRHEAMVKNPLFKGMEFSDDPAKLMEWIPLIMNGRKDNEPIAATKVDYGTDVNFGALTRMLFEHLESKGVEVNYKHKVQKLKRANDGSWEVVVHDLDGCKAKYYNAKFIFLGAGGGSLELLQKLVFLKENISVDSL